MSLVGISSNFVTKLKFVNLAICTQLRWRKEPKRKPRWLPMAASKMFRIPVHPYVSPDEENLMEDLMDEYYRKTNSLRQAFINEIKQKLTSDEIILNMQKEEEEEFKLLLEENKKENERIKKIREEILEKEFQEKQLQMLQMAELKQQELQETKFKIEEIVKAEKFTCIILCCVSFIFGERIVFNSPAALEIKKIKQLDQKYGIYNSRKH